MNQEFEKLNSSIKATVMALPVLMGNAAVNWAVDSFRVQGWRSVSNIGEAWRQRKRDKRVGRALLIKSGRLRRSIRILKLTANSVEFGTDVPYAEAHNNGSTKLATVKAHTRKLYGKAKASSVNTKRKKTITYQSGLTTVKAHNRKISLPRRQFMPVDNTDSPIFMAEIENVIKEQLKPYFNN